VLPGDARRRFPSLVTQNLARRRHRETDRNHCVVRFSATLFIPYSVLVFRIVRHRQRDRAQLSNVIQSVARHQGSASRPWFTTSLVSSTFTLLCSPSALPPAVLLSNILFRCRLLSCSCLSQWHPDGLAGNPSPMARQLPMLQLLRL